MMKRRRHILTNVATAAAVAGGLLLAAGAPGPRAWADAGGNAVAREEKVKAAFVYNFVQLTEWPAEAFDGPASPLVVCVVGRGPFADAVGTAVSGKRAGDRSISFRRCDDPADIPPCQVLVVVVTAQERARDALAAVNGKSVLSVGEGDAFLPAGGTIRFFTENNKMRFEVNQPAAARANLKISSKLLGLAKIYPGGR